MARRPCTSPSPRTQPDRTSLVQSEGPASLGRGKDNRRAQHGHQHGQQHGHGRRLRVGRRRLVRPLRLFRSCDLITATSPRGVTSGARAGAAAPQATEAQLQSWRRESRPPLRRSTRHCSATTPSCASLRRSTRHCSATTPSCASLRRSTRHCSATTPSCASLSPRRVANRARSAPGRRLRVGPRRVVRPLGLFRSGHVNGALRAAGGADRALRTALRDGSSEMARHLGRNVTPSRSPSPPAR